MLSGRSAFTGQQFLTAPENSKSLVKTLNRIREIGYSNSTTFFGFFKTNEAIFSNQLQMFVNVLTCKRGTWRLPCRGSETIWEILNGQFEYQTKLHGGKPRCLKKTTSAIFMAQTFLLSVSRFSSFRCASVTGERTTL